MWIFYLWNSLGVHPVSNEEETSRASLRWRRKNLRERNKTKQTKTAAALRDICLQHSEENNPVSRSALCCALWARCWGGGIAWRLNWGIAAWAAATVNLLDVQQLVSQQHKRRRCRCDWTARGAKTVLFPPDFHYIQNRLLQKQHLWITFKTFHYCSFLL